MILSAMVIFIVTPLAGVWIEISTLMRRLTPAAVTPLAGVWIEMSFLPVTTC